MLKQKYQEDTDVGANDDLPNMDQLWTKDFSPLHANHSITFCHHTIQIMV